MQRWSLGLQDSCTERRLTPAAFASIRPVTTSLLPVTARAQVGANFANGATRHGGLFQAPHVVARWIRIADHGNEIGGRHEPASSTFQFRCQMITSGRIGGVGEGDHGNSRQQVG
jgi:hypothetical protein